MEGSVPVGQVLGYAVVIVGALVSAIGILYFRMAKLLDEERKSAKEAWTTHSAYVEKKLDQFVEAAKAQGTTAEALTKAMERERK